MPRSNLESGWFAFAQFRLLYFTWQSDMLLFQFLNTQNLSRLNPMAERVMQPTSRQCDNTSQSPKIQHAGCILSMLAPRPMQVCQSTFFSLSASPVAPQ